MRYFRHFYFINIFRFFYLYPEMSRVDIAFFIGSGNIYIFDNAKIGTVYGKRAFQIGV